ncbi:helix-turn-helix domain-containing protein [Streptomyces sp. TRM66268-LWL]|uniref:Helix-turn-helix domain-containing protein n=1 Tax=Streptomyces polyasparticus TaxID=2767826 RepID=A0ABR7SC54_9ACTN|nr:helix-turn-helix domain-containing protein [Streptomyces polyasparticus]MBC9712998.1 helix-turn-helix domain-containing protein [Streptomyces polyasparticus]
MYSERVSAYAGAVVWRNRPSGAGGVYPVLPDGCMDLLWVDGQLVVAGPDTRAYRPLPGPGREAAGIRFAPGTAPALFGVPARELLDRRVELSDLWPAARVRRLAGRVAAAADPRTGLEELALATDAAPADPALLHAARRLRQGATVAAIADETGLGARTLHRRSLAAFGYGPKTLARILRLQRALALARSGLPAADTAAAAGYADQPHLAREVRDLAGMTLNELLSLTP